MAWPRHARPDLGGRTFGHGVFELVAQSHKRANVRIADTYALRVTGDDHGVLRFAPRYDDRLLDALRRLDDPRLSFAEICRRVGGEAERLGLPRPRALTADVAVDLLVGKAVNAYDVAARVHSIDGRHS